MDLSSAHYLQRCLEIARQSHSRAEPNPRVGAVIVHQGRIIGEGHHARYGEAHAEVMAVQSVSEEDRPLLPQSTLYVSLEPCRHHGKTPACTDLILRERIPHVVVGSTDPNPQMAGASIQLLREKGLKVELAEDARPFQALNRHFETNQAKSRAHILLKWAQSPDGFMAATDSRGRLLPTPISGEDSRRLVHRLRAESQAILVGRNTALTDNPSLNVRAWPGPDPIRIVLDPDLELPSHLQLFRGAPVVIVNRRKSQRAGNVVHYSPPTGEAFQDLSLMAQCLFQDLEIGSILVEGGAETHRHFLRTGAWDELVVIEGGPDLGQGLKAPELPEGLTFSQRIPVGDDLWSYAGPWDGPWL